MTYHHYKAELPITKLKIDIQSNQMLEDKTADQFNQVLLVTCREPHQHLEAMFWFVGTVKQDRAYFDHMAQELLEHSIKNAPLTVPVLTRMIETYRPS